MRKQLFLLLAFLFLQQGHAQSTISFTVLSTSGGYSITCANPTLNLLCITNYTYSFVTYTLAGPTGTAIGNNFPVTSPGIYTLTAYVTNVTNSTQTLAIGINTQAPISTISPTTQNITCSFTSATTVSTTANPSLGVIHYFISPSGNTVAINNSTATYVPGMVGTHTYILLDQQNGCKTNKSFMVNSGSSIPTASVSSPQSFTLGCNSNSVCSVGITGAASTFGNPISFTIMSAGSTTNYITNSQNLYSFSVSGTYTAVVHDNVTNCEAHVPFSIVTKTSTPSFSVFVNTQTLNCNLTQTQLYGFSSTPNTSVIWGIPGSTVTPSTYSVNATTNTAIATSSVIGNYTFLVVDNSNACSSESIITMYQNIYPPNVLIGNSGSNSITCTTPSVMLQDQSTTGIPPGNFPNSQTINVISWNGPSSPTGTNNTYAAFSAGFYTLSVSDPNNGCTGKATYVIMDGRLYPIVNNPVARPPYCMDPPTTTLDISPILSGPVSSYSYNWSSPSTATVSGQGTATLNTNAIGVYSITVTHVPSGCSTNGQVLVTICSGIGEWINTGKDLSIYPNPGGPVLRFYANSFSTEKSQLQIMSINGTLLRSVQLGSEPVEVDMGSEAQGMYLAILTHPDGTRTIKKFVLGY